VEKQIENDPMTMIRATWSETFSLPPNDERLLRLTVKEALEQILMRRAVQKAQAKEFQEKARPTLETLNQDSPIKAEVETVTGKEAEKVADKPNYTGDPEWDAIEREETDPFREPFDMKRFITDGG
jgi:hypothetical protein